MSRPSLWPVAGVERHSTGLSKMCLSSSQVRTSLWDSREEEVRACGDLQGFVPMEGEQEKFGRGFIFCDCKAGY